MRNVSVDKTPEGRCWLVLAASVSFFSVQSWSDSAVISVGIDAFYIKDEYILSSTAWLDFGKI